ncbi:MAG TPA: isoprenylcysteine carboxylmethyltransferase family protein [Anaerolineae bacterium]|nr:isoprenylcysteine carboxylmethyltransferase family protein [Anaerolineae bacterium]
MREPVLILAALLGFSAFHSLLASHAAKSAARRLFGEHNTRGWYRLVYNAFAAISLLPVLVLSVVLPDRELYRIPAPLSAVAIGIQALAALGVLYSLYQLDLRHFTGLRQWMAWVRGIEAHSASDTSTSRLVVDGLHRYVRHPLYTTSLIALWFVSPMTVNRLAFVAGVTLYFTIGSIFEERKLTAEFGDAYREYQRRVPRLVPRPRIRREPAESSGG